jgi:uncharacterized protein DUF839
MKETLMRTALKSMVFAAGTALIAIGGVRADGLTPVPKANPRTAGLAPPTVLSLELYQWIVGQGAVALENGTAAFPYYGYAGDGAQIPEPGDVQSFIHNVEATKTEPDKNTYLILPFQNGPDPDYNYGLRFLFQGHENGALDPATGKRHGLITRINLDADAAHRVTLLAAADKEGGTLPLIDGSTWDPWARRLLFTSESGNQGGVWQATAEFPSTVEDISGVLGRGGYEGIQNDSAGNLWIIEDVGGPRGFVNNFARQPNSFLYRFVPKERADLKAGGVLQALQVMSNASPGQPVVFHAGLADADILSQDVKDLHTYSQVFQTRWVPIHDTDVDGIAPFDANALAKIRMATPFKRPENGQFRPGSLFREFFFDETGDTDSHTQAGSQYGGFGSIMKLTQPGPSSNTGRLTLFYQCDLEHSGFDNVAFWSPTQVVFVEDAGDTLHTQRDALDSAYLFDTTLFYGLASTPPPVRILAEGRDPSATLDSALGGQPGFQNDGDNEITGLHVSDGDPTVFGILGAKPPSPFRYGWRVFYTQQHGDNNTWEIGRRTPLAGFPW